MNVATVVVGCLFYQGFNLIHTQIIVVVKMKYCLTAKLVGSPLPFVVLKNSSQP